MSGASRVLLLGLALAAGCGGAARRGNGGPAPLRTEAEAQAALGQQVRVAGKAVDAKFSAAVQVQGGLVVYCIDQHDWPAEREGKAVVVAGRLERSDAYQAQTDGTGAISQGTEGPIYILRGCAAE